MPQDTAATREKASNQRGYSIGSDYSALASIYSKIKAKIQIAGGYSQADTFLREVYSGMLPANPGITQKAALFRGVACAYYKIICEDTILNQPEKSRRMESIVQAYEKNLKEIFHRTAKSSGKREGDILSTKATLTPFRNETPAFKIIPVLIIYNKELTPRIYWNDEQMTCRDTFLPGGKRAWLCDIRQYPGRTNQIKIQDRNGIIRCEENIGQMNGRYQQIYPCI